MIFEYTSNSILNGEQTKVCLPYAETLEFDPVRRAVFDVSDAPQYFCGQTVPIYSKRGMNESALAAVRLLNIQDMTLQDVKHEDMSTFGCRDFNDFVAVWTLTHGTFNRHDPVLVFDFHLSEVFSSDAEARRRLAAHVA